MNEVLTFSNTGAATLFQACPGGVPCAQYVDTSNATIGWPSLTLAIPAYSTALALWNNSPNLIMVPSVSMTIDSGSIPSGTMAHVSWSISNSTQSSISYITSTGSFSMPISGTGDIYFKPPAGTTTTTYIYTQNEVGNRINQVDVTTTNTPPIVFPVTITGNEDDPLIV